MLAGLGGCLFVLYVNSAQASSFGNFYELYAIAGAVLGGVALRGGEGVVLGVVLGSALMQLLSNSINLVADSNQLEFAVVGAVILFGAGFDEGIRRFLGLSSDSKALVIFGVASFVLLAVGGWLTSLGMGPWYDALQKPWFQPPSWVFAPAWTTILTLLAVASWQVWSRAASARIGALYATQFVLNALWSLFFFAMAAPVFALVDILILDVVVISMFVLYRRVHAPAGWMIAPYVLWLLLATAINVAIVVRN